MSGARLRYVSDETEGIVRKGRGKGFAYYFEGKLVTDAAEKERIKALAIPPAWTDVWICPGPEGHIQATGRDSKGRKQYVYHEMWSVLSSESKFGSLASFGESLTAIRKRVRKDLARRKLDRDKVLAAVIDIMDKTFMRIGSERYAKLNDSYGLTTLENCHVTVTGGTAEFSYRAKGGKERSLSLTDRAVANTIKRCMEIPGYRIFRFVDGNGNVSAVDSDSVNEKLREITGHGFTSKDFRTWGATVAALNSLKKAGESEAGGEKAIVRAVKEAAKVLGNTPATCRKYYVHPAILDAWRSGKIGAYSTPRGRRKYLSPDEVEVLRILKKVK
ncbi:MAG TPA: DNA topoisomerase IB [Thermodesulfobacteriota bacterium]|nr:DNA topoisomerase IB [Thermodesulfobacteriota bacterium]